MEHDIVSKITTLRKKKFGKYEICDGFYNSLLSIIKIKNMSKSMTYSWPILNKGVQKGWN